MTFNYTFSKEADYDLPKEQRSEPEPSRRCYESYIPSDELVKVVNLAIALKLPILLEGEPGSGKTKLASALVYQLTQNNLRSEDPSKTTTEWWPFYTWTVKSYSRARDGLYTFDAIARLRDAQLIGSALRDTLTPDEIARIKDPNTYLKLGALGNALKREDQHKEKRAVVLIDEIDKADNDFANDLLLELDEFRFDIPETKESIAAPPEPPIIILTSNREKPLPDAFLRRCLYFSIDFPKADALSDIVKARSATKLTRPSQKLLTKAIETFELVRGAMSSQPGARPPGTSEFLRFWEALCQKKVAEATTILDNLPDHIPMLGLLLKTKSDQELYIKKALSLKASQAAKEGGTRP
jgi:MoxR-like ATPase